jgi:chloride channel protein, CIC family
MLGALVSQAVSRKLSRYNFYEEILVQDGHQLEHVVPPRNLQSWQQLPISAIANFQPVLVHDTTPAALTKLLKSHPYQRFPVVLNGTVSGILTRKEAQAALQEKRPPKWEAAVTCLPQQTIADLQNRLIESTLLLVILVDQPGGKVLGLVTLHDLLRAQTAMSKAGTS